MSPFLRLLLLTLLAAGTLSATGDAASPMSGQDSATPTPTPGPTPTPTPTPSPTPTADAEEQLEEFVPTEDLPADQAVAFPVDI